MDGALKANRRKFGAMTYLTADSSESIGKLHDEERLPYYLAMPVWLLLAAASWIPIVLLVGAFA